MEDRRPGISGQVIDVRTRGGVAGLRVEAWVWSGTQPGQALIGVAVAGPDGRFEIPLGEASPGDGRQGYEAADLAEVIFRVFDNEEPVKNVEHAVGWDVLAGETEVVIEVGVPPGPPESTEVALHELGESLAVTVASVQEELARYPTDLGAYLLDEVDLNVPVHLRVNEMGQMMATVVQTETPASAIGQLHLRLRPVLGASQPARVSSGQPLAALNALSPEAISRLEAQRVFSVDDLLRVARNPSGRAALTNLDLQTDLEGVMNRADVLTLPMLPNPVSETLVRIGVEAPADFVNGDPAALAESLTEELEQAVAVEDIEGWQREVGEALMLPLPSQQQS